MFGLFQRNKPVVHDHWYVLIPDFKSSTSSFYDEVNRELTERKVPGLDVVRTPIPEGSLLSARREYLRMRRERLLFEVCSTSFGTSWFFSCRFSEFPLRFRFRYLVLLVVLAATFWFAHQQIFGLFWGTGVFLFSCAGLIFLLKGVVPMGLVDLDQRLLRLPVIGPVYEIFLRADTYFREDSRIMYCDLVNSVVRSKVEEFAGRQNIKNIEFKRDELAASHGRSVLGDLWRAAWAGWKKR